jgi:hypothetical protein
LLEIIFEYTFNATIIYVYDVDETALNKFKRIAKLIRINLINMKNKERDQ